VRHDVPSERAKRAERGAEGEITDLEAKVDELYSGPLDAFTRVRDALAAELKGDAEAAKHVKGLRKPVVSAWALNRLAREDPQGVAELVGLGERLRAAQRRALSGGDAEELRAALDDRRRLVGALTGEAAAILEREGTGPGAHQDDLGATLEAAAADEDAGRLLLAGRLVKPLRPPAELGGGGLRVLEGGGRGRAPATEPEAELGERGRERRAQIARVRRELTSAQAAERKAAGAVEKARGRLEELEAKRGEAREAVRRAQAEHRGATLEAKRLAAALSKLERSS
jgi:hypothetical protein